MTILHNAKNYWAGTVTLVSMTAFTGVLLLILLIVTVLFLTDGLRFIVIDLVVVVEMWASCFAVGSIGFSILEWVVVVVVFSCACAEAAVRIKIVIVVNINVLINIILNLLLFAV